MHPRGGPAVGRRADAHQRAENEDVTTTTPGLLSIILLGAGAGLSRVAPRKETRSLAIAHGALAALSAVVAAVVADGRSRELVGGLLVMDSLTATMLVAVAAAAISLALALPMREAGHRTMSQTLMLPALVGLALMANRLWLLVLVDAAITVVVVQACEPRARRALILFRGLGLLCVAAAVGLSGRGAATSALSEASQSLPLRSAVLMVVGVGLQAGVGPASIAHRAAFSAGITGRGVLSVLPFAGFAVLVRVAGPALAHTISEVQAQQLHALILVLALVTATLLLVQRTVGGALALAVSTSNALALVGLIEPDRGASLGGEILWAATLMAAGGMSVCLLALRARHGRLVLDRYSGYYAGSPRVAGFLLLFALALGGLPGTLNFAALDLVLHGDISHHLGTMVLGAVVMAVFGFATVRMAFRLLYGRPPRDERDNDMPILVREQYALLPLALVLIVVGLFPSALPVVRDATQTVAHAVSDAGDPSHRDGM